MEPYVPTVVYALDTILVIRFCRTDGSPTTPPRIFTDSNSFSSKIDARILPSLSPSCKMIVASAGREYMELILLRSLEVWFKILLPRAWEALAEGLLHYLSNQLIRLHPTRLVFRFRPGSEAN